MTPPGDAPVTTTDLPERFDLASEVPSDDRLAVIRAALPEVFQEGKIDFDALRRSLGDWVDPGPERFGLTWPGKAECIRVIQEPSIGTLVPMSEESVEWDSTQNVVIEGDNLEVLKLLQKAYYGKVKMIYIDPPYNTGKEFIYPDNFREGLADYLRYSGQVDEEGLRLTANAETDGRYHSKWLSMMYPRLFLARNLLREDGVIFVSIDDHEIHNLRALMNELFGEENFVACLVWNAEGHTDNQFQVKVMHEYVLVYAREASRFEAGYFIDPNTRSESNLWRGVAENSITKNGPKNPPSWITLPVGFPCAVDQLDLPPTGLTPDEWQLVEELSSITRELSGRLRLVFPLRKSPLVVRDGRLSHAVAVYSGWANAEKLRRFIDGECAPLAESDGSSLEFYLSDRGVVYYRRHREGLARNIVSVLRNVGTTEKMRSELESGGIHFDYPKPRELLDALIQIGGASDNDLVVDFFAGSGTTADAVLRINSGPDGPSALRFLLVQLPENAREARGGTISATTRDRVRWVCETLAGSSRALLKPHAADLGFRADRLSRSNFSVWPGEARGPEEIAEQLALSVEHVLDGSTEWSMLTELLLKAGYPLTCSVAELDFASVPGYSVSEGALFVCLAPQLTIEAFEAMAERDPAMILVLDSGFGGSDELKVNALQTVRARNQRSGSDITLRVV
jgi:adenine-specific DNA-methyltransferase